MITCSGPSSLGCARPAAPSSSLSAFSVFWWKLKTRSALSGTTSARMRRGSCVVTPVGQWPVWQVCACRQPRANMKPRAELHQSAPMAMVRAMSNAVTILPLAATRTRSRRFTPTSELCTSMSASRSGAPTWSVNSSGAAPVPPSPPSTTTKSGVMPVSTIAFTIPNHSQGWPMASLKPVGLPPERVRSRSTNRSSSMGVENAECRAGEMQSTPSGTWRACGDLRRHLGARQHAAVARLRSLRELHLDHLHLVRGGVGDEALLVEAAGVVAAAEVAAADLPHEVAAGLAVVARDRALAGVVVEAPAPRALVEREDRVGRQRPEAHGRDVEDARRVRLRHPALADADPEVVAPDLHRRDRVVDPLVVRLVEVHLRAERALVDHALGALVDDRALGAGEGRVVGVGLDEVLADLGPDVLEEEAEVRDDGVVAADRLAGLREVHEADQRQDREHRPGPQPQGRKRRHREARRREERAGRPGPVALRDDSVDHASHVHLLDPGPSRPRRRLYGMPRPL